jgi:hypothetical protein
MSDHWSGPVDSISAICQCRIGRSGYRCEIPCNTGWTGLECASLNCPAGQQCIMSDGTELLVANSSLVQLPCPSGHFCPGNSAPIRCQPGSYCPAPGMSSALPCVAGLFCSGGSQPPQLCPVGSFCPAGSAAPTPCPLNTYCLKEGLSEPMSPVWACPSPSYGLAGILPGQPSTATPVCCPKRPMPPALTADGQCAWAEQNQLAPVIRFYWDQYPDYLSHLALALSRPLQFCTDKWGLACPSIDGTQCVDFEGRFNSQCPNAGFQLRNEPMFTPCIEGTPMGMCGMNWLQDTSVGSGRIQPHFDPSVPAVDVTFQCDTIASTCRSNGTWCMATYDGHPWCMDA